MRLRERTVSATVVLSAEAAVPSEAPRASSSSVSSLFDLVVVPLSSRVAVNFGDDACLIDEHEVCLQADRIGSALDVVERLAVEMAVEDGTGAGSQLASKARRAVPDPIHLVSESSAVPEGLGPFSPGQVGPVHGEPHASGGYEQRAWGLSGGAPKLIAKA